MNIIITTKSSRVLVGTPLSFLCIFLQLWPEFNLTLGNFPPLAFNMFSSPWLLTLGIFWELQPLLPPLYPSPSLSVKAKASPLMGIFITKKSTKEPALFQGWQVNGISAETETRCGIIGTESACFSRGHPLGKKREREEWSKAWRRHKIWVEIRLKNPPLNVILPFNILWTRTVPTVCV